MDKHIIIIAPFWGQTSSPGNIRIERFLRWITENSSYSVVIIKAGTKKSIRKMPWGIELTIRDPLGCIVKTRQEVRISLRESQINCAERWHI